jgi:hypothetical protein
MAEVHVPLVRRNESESGAEATALSRNAGLARPPDIPEPREASGLRRVHRRFSSSENEISPLFKVAKCGLDSGSHPVTNCDQFTESQRLVLAQGNLKT